ncbi:MAG: hypothetical protein ACLPHP_02340 [Candidatus Sulfotelmatobacter sp.]
MADRKQDELDSMLDAALAKYAAVEPRAGLEGRVLANVQAERDRVPNRAWWRWSLAGALAALVVVALALAWRSGKPSHPAVANQFSTAPHVPKQPTTPVVATGGRNEVRGNQARPQERAALRRAGMLRPQSKVDAGNPKLDQFPSPRPLSEQEKILESYVANYPEHAALIARARAEELRRDAAEEMNTGEAGSEKGSQQ